MTSIFINIFFSSRIEKPLSTVQTGPQGRPGGRVPANRSRGEACSYLTILLADLDWERQLQNLLFAFLGWNRQISWFRTRKGAFPPAVFCVYVGKWHLDPSPPPDAQHGSASGLSGPHSKDGCDQDWPFDYMGGLCVCSLFLFFCFFNFDCFSWSTNVPCNSDIVQNEQLWSDMLSSALLMFPLLNVQI